MMYHIELSICHEDMQKVYFVHWPSRPMVICFCQWSNLAVTSDIEFWVHFPQTERDWMFNRQLILYNRQLILCNRKLILYNRQLILIAGMNVVATLWQLVRLFIYMILCMHADQTWDIKSSDCKDHFVNNLWSESNRPVTSRLLRLTPDNLYLHFTIIYPITNTANKRVQCLCVDHLEWVETSSNLLRGHFNY